MDQEANPSDRLLYTPLSSLDSLLIEAYQDHLVSELTPDGEVLLERKSKKPSPLIEHESFMSLLRDGMLQQCAFNAPPNRLPRAVYSVSNQGLHALKGLADRLKGMPVITEAKWAESRMTLCWEDPQSVWESFQGQVFCRIEDEFGRVISREEILADVEILRLRGDIFKASGILLGDAINALPGLQGYEDLPKGSDGDAETLEDLPRILGLFDASSHNLIMVNFIKIRPLYIGTGTGAQVLRKLLSGLGPGGGIAVVSPHPLQFGMLEENGKFGAAFELACKNLNSYYRRLGFIEHPRSNRLMVCDLGNKKLKSVPL